LLPVILRAAQRKFFTLFVGVAVLVFAVSLLVTGGVRFIFLPALSSDTISASLEMPIGTPFATTHEVAQRILRAADEVNARFDGAVFDSVNSTIGGRMITGGGPGGRQGMTISSHSASMRIQLTPESSRTLSAVELEKYWREAVGAVPGVESLTYSAQFFNSGPEIEYELSHPDDAVLELAAEQLKADLATLPEANEILDTYARGKRQFDITLTAAGEAAGLLPADVARQLRQNFFGEEVQRIQRGREELKVMVRYPRSNRRSTADLDQVRIRLDDGTQAPISAVATLTESRGFSEIDRVDGRRVVKVTAKVDSTIATPDEANARLQDEFVPDLKARFPGLTVVQGGSGREQSDDLAALGSAMLVAIMVIYTLLATQLRSYLQPLIVLSSIPFGAGGAIIGHFLLGFDLSFISIFGIIALSGVAVNGSLVLVDRYNFVRNTTDMSPLQAIESATKRRFRAIFLTTLTTALGLLPMLLETSIQAQFLIPMAVSLATGVLFSSMVILFVVPAMVMILEGLKTFFGYVAEPVAV
jgi:multidrug efflux pump subunit AcrB